MNNATNPGINAAGRTWHWSWNTCAYHAAGISAEIFTIEFAPFGRYGVRKADGDTVEVATTYHTILGARVGLQTFESAAQAAIAASDAEVRA